MAPRNRYLRRFFMGEFSGAWRRCFGDVGGAELALVSRHHQRAASSWQCVQAVVPSLEPRTVERPEKSDNRDLKKTF